MKKFIFDPSKDRANQEKHGISLTLAERFDWDHASYQPDVRKDYGEHRMIGTGLVGARLHVMVFAVRGGKYRIISLRKANGKERKKYEKEKAVH